PKESRRYEKELARRLPDLVLVGIGTNGHVAYVEPGETLVPETARVRLSVSTRRGLAAGGMRPVPREALTMGIESILAAREILLVATGKATPRGPSPAGIVAITRRLRVSTTETSLERPLAV